MKCLPVLMFVVFFASASNNVVALNQMHRRKLALKTVRAKQGSTTVKAKPSPAKPTVKTQTRKPTTTTTQDGAYAAAYKAENYRSSGSEVSGCSGFRYGNCRAVITALTVTPGEGMKWSEGALLFW